MMKKILLLIFLSLTSAIVTGQDASELITSAQEKIKAADFQGALDEYSKAVATVEPKVKEALTAIKAATPEAKRTFYRDLAVPYCGKGAMEIKLGKKEEARKSIDMAIVLDPSLGEAYYHRGTLNSASKDNACIDYRLAITNGYQRGQIAYDENFCWNLSLVYSKEGLTKLNTRKYEEAIKDFESAINLNPDSAINFIRRGQAYAGLGKNDLALEDYKKAVTVDPKKAEAFYWLGVAFVNQEKPEEAYQNFSKAIELNPKYYEAFLARAKVDEAMEQFNNAIYDYTECIKLKSSDGFSYYRRGILKRDKIQNNKAACADLKMAVSLGCYEAEEEVTDCK